MNNLRQEAERILETFRKLEAYELDNDKDMIDYLENGLKRAWIGGGIAANERAQQIIRGDDNGHS